MIHIRMPQMPIFNTQDTSLYYEIRRARSSNHHPIPIIFLHGAGGNSASWFNQLAFFSEKFDCIAFVQVKTGATGDEEPYKGEPIDDKFAIDKKKVWEDYRIEAFEQFKKYFS